MKYLFLLLLLAGCASGPNHYVTNEQLRFRLNSFCDGFSYDSLGGTEFKTFTEAHEHCMAQFVYWDDESHVRDDWRSK